MIKISNLNKYFYHKKSNEIHVINDTTIQFPETGLVTIFGESGCGKTTLMNVLGGLDDFYSGSIEIDNFKINKYNSKKIDRIRNEKIGYIFQNYLLLQQRTVYDNLLLLLNMYDISLEEKNERIDYVLESVGMLKYKKKNVSELSGGQQQRVAIARALIKSPSLILADEPTGNLDEKNTIQIMNIIKKISKTTLVILVSHEKSIATSYSDYIIQIEDGKIKSNTKLEEGTLYHYEDDQNIYLKEFEYKNISNDNVNIDFYSNDNININIQIVYKNGKVYIKSETDTILVDENSEINFINENKKVLNANDEILDNNFELKRLDFVKTPSLSFKEKINLTFSNLKKLKKRTKILSLPLFILIILALLSIQSVVSASYIDKQDLVKQDSHIYSINLERTNKYMPNEVYRFGFKKVYDKFIEENNNIEVLLLNQVELYFELPKFSQTKNKTYEISGFSVLPTEHINEADLLYGRLPENVNEIVIEKWVLETVLNETTLSNFMNIKSFLNKEVNFKTKAFPMKIVGIADTNENTVYMNKWKILNISPSEMKKENMRVISYSEFIKIYNGTVNIELKENEVIQCTSFNYKFGNKNLKLNNDQELNFNIVEYLDIKSTGFNFVVHDSAYEKIFKSIASNNYGYLNLYCEKDLEKSKVDEFVNKNYEYFNSGNLLATEENGFYGFADYKNVSIGLSSYSSYDDILSPYIEESNKNVSNRLLITLTILLITVIIVFFSMKSYSIKNIYDIGVYRAIGIKKGSIVFVYALEILIISLKTTLVGGIFAYLVSNIIQGIPVIDIQIGISFNVFLVSTISLIVLNVLVGILPVMGYLKLTPSQILSKYDI